MDTSALAKRYIREKNSEKVYHLVSQATEILVSSLCIPELFSALNRRLTEGVLNQEIYLKIKGNVLADMSEVTVVDVSTPILNETIRCLERSSLRTLDAIQVASALHVKPDRFLSADARQCDAAKKFGLPVTMLASFLMLIFFSSNVAALTLRGAYQIAASNNQQIQIQSEKIRQAQARYDQTFGALLPHVSVLGSETYLDSPTASRRPEYKVSVKQSLFGGFRDWDALGGLGAQIRKQRLLLDQTKRDVFQQTVQLFFQGMLIQKDLQNIREVTALAKTRITDLQHRANVGKSRSSEVLSAQAQLLNLNAQEEQLNSQLRTTNLNLSNLLGHDIDSPDYEDVEFEINSPKWVENRPELLVLKEEIAYQKSLKQIASNSFLPNVNAGANYYLKRTDALAPITWDATLTVEVPLFQGGSEWATTTEADSVLRQLEIDYVQQHRTIQTALQADMVALNSSLSQKKTLYDAYQKTKQSFQIYLNEYRLGLINNLEVLQALNNLLDMKRSLDRADIQYKSNLVQLKIDQQELP